MTVETSGDERDDQFFDLGFTRPEDAEALRAAHTDPIDAYGRATSREKSSRKNTPRSRVPDGDGIQYGPLEHVAPEVETARAPARVLARQALHQIIDRNLKQRANKDDMCLPALQRAHNERE